MMMANVQILEALGELDHVMLEIVNGLSAFPLACLDQVLGAFVQSHLLVKSLKILLGHEVFQDVYLLGHYVFNSSYEALELVC